MSLLGKVFAGIHVDNAMQPTVSYSNCFTEVNTKFAIFNFHENQPLNKNGFSTGNIVSVKNSDTEFGHRQEYMIYGSDIDIKTDIKTNGEAGGLMLNSCNGEININCKNGKKETIIIQGCSNVKILKQDENDNIIFREPKNYYNRK